MGGRLMPSNGSGAAVAPAPVALPLPGLPAEPVRARRQRRRGPLELLSTTATNPFGAVNQPRPSWATEGRPLQAEEVGHKKRSRSEPPTALDLMRGKRVQRVRSRVIANAMLHLPATLVRADKYERTLCCGREVRRARFVAGEGARVDFGRACRQRWCESCSGARLGKWRAQYSPLLAEWKQLVHLVVTVPCVRQMVDRRTGHRHNAATAAKLRAKIQEMQKAAREIANDVRRTARLPWKAVRHLECTYTWRRDGEILDWYHPHFHFVVESEAAAREFMRRWLLRFPDASPAAQYVEVVDLGKAMREVFKYVTKAVKSHREPLRDDSGRVMRDAAGKVKTAVRYEGIRADALDVIYAAMRGLRLHQAMGFRAAAVEDMDPEAGLQDDGTLPPALPDFESDESTWRWSDDILDWEQWQGSEPLSGAALPLRYVKMLARYEAEIFLGVPCVGGVRTNGLVAKCAYIRHSSYLAALELLYS